MCQGIPGTIVERYETAGTKMCKVDFGGVIQEACIETLPEDKIGDYTIIHAGFALSLLSEKDAQETLTILREIAQLEDEERTNLPSTSD